MKFVEWLKRQPGVSEDTVQWAEVQAELQAALGVLFPQKLFDEHLKHWYERFVAEDDGEVDLL